MRTQHHHLAAPRTHRDGVARKLGQPPLHLLDLGQSRLEERYDLRDFIAVVGWDLHQWQSGGQEHILDELVGAARPALGNRPDQFDTDLGLQALWMAQQKVYVLAEQFIKIMNVLIRADDKEDIVQRDFGENDVALSSHFSERPIQYKFGCV